MKNYWGFCWGIFSLKAFPINFITWSFISQKEIRYWNQHHLHLRQYLIRWDLPWLVYLAHIFVRSKLESFNKFDNSPLFPGSNVNVRYMWIVAQIIVLLPYSWNYWQNNFFQVAPQKLCAISCVTEEKFPECLDMNQKTIGFKSKHLECFLIFFKKHIYKRQFLVPLAHSCNSSFWYWTRLEAMSKWEN